MKKATSTVTLASTRGPKMTRSGTVMTDSKTGEVILNDSYPIALPNGKTGYIPLHESDRNSPANKNVIKAEENSVTVAVTNDGEIAINTRKMDANGRYARTPDGKAIWETNMYPADKIAELNTPEALAKKLEQKAQVAAINAELKAESEKNKLTSYNIEKTKGFANTIREDNGEQKLVSTNKLRVVIAIPDDGVTLDNGVRIPGNVEIVSHVNPDQLNPSKTQVKVSNPDVQIPLYKTNGLSDQENKNGYKLSNPDTPIGTASIAAINQWYDITKGKRPAYSASAKNLDGMETPPTNDGMEMQETDLPKELE